jgi:hypothetical protein
MVTSSPKAMITLCASATRSMSMLMCQILPDGAAAHGLNRKVGGAALGWSCFGASDHGPVSFRRVGQSVDLPVKARRWGHDLRGSPQSGCLKPWSRPPQPQRVSPTSGPQLASAPPGAASRGADRRRAAPQRRRAPAPCAGLEPVEKVVTQSEARDVSGPGRCLTLRSQLTVSLLQPDVEGVIARLRRDIGAVPVISCGPRRCCR